MTGVTTESVELVGEDIGISVDDLADQIADGLGDDVDFERDPEAPQTEDDPEGDPEGDIEDGEEEEESDEDGGDDEDQPNPSIDDETLVDIKIGDDDYEVNFAELRSGYLRNEDYIARSQKLEQDYQTRVEELEQKREELLQELTAASTIVRSDTSRYDNINWEALKAQDPDQYNKLRVEALEAKEQSQALEERRKNVAKIQQKAQELRFEAYRTRQAELTTQLIPDWDKVETKQALVDYAREVGFTDDEIGGIVDARLLLLLHNGLQHSKAAVRRKEAAEKKVTKELPPVNKPGAAKPQNHSDRARSKALHNRFKSDKSVESAAALLAASFDQ